MGDISTHLPKETATVQAIYDSYKARGDAETPRTYLGVSIIGHQCDRYLWYNFRHCASEKFSGRMYRLFQTGHLSEDRFLADLRTIGCEAYGVDPATGKQFGFEALGGHLRGHMDGAALGIPEAPKTWHVLEFKTHGSKSFTKLKKDGVLKAKPMHYAQMMLYMHLSGMKRALYLAVNKDTDELYSERIRYSSEEAKQLMERAEQIIFATSAPERCANRRDDFRCKFCEAKGLCWGDRDRAVPIPFLSCRQCCHATPCEDTGETWARWHCEKHGKDLAPAEQLQACEDHLLLPSLVNFAATVDTHRVDNGWEGIEYINHGDETHWLQGRAEIAGAYPSATLMTIPHALIAGPEGQAVTDILAYYPPEDVEILWAGAHDSIGAAWNRLFAEDMAADDLINTCDFETHTAAEYSNGRVGAVHYPSGTAAILRMKV